MRIAVNTECLVKDSASGIGRYTNELLKHIVLQHPEHEFLFLFSEPFDENFVYAGNVKAQVIGTGLQSNVVFRFWYDIKLAAALKKFKANIFISFNGMACLTTKLPQVLMVNDLGFVHNPNFYKTSTIWFHRIYQKKFIEKANQIVVANDFLKDEVIKHYPIAAEKITVVKWAAAEKFAPVSYDEREAIKATYTEEREYFLFVGGNHPRKNLMNVLKAFSVFKKWQHSNMKLVIIGKLDEATNDLLEKLKSYKHRDDVVTLTYLPDEKFAKLLASAYALVNPSIYENFGLTVFEAMQSGTPVIAGNNSAMVEAGCGIALLAQPNDVAEIANQLKILYRDEVLRNQLIVEGVKLASKFSWKASADKLYKIIEASASK